MSNKLFFVLYAAISAASLWLRSAVPAIAISAAVHDDFLFVRQAYYLGAGAWLGPFDNLTLAKGMAYPAFILAAFVSGLPLKIAEHLVYLAAAGLAAWMVSRIARSRGLGLTLFAVLAFNPVFWHEQLARVIREGLYGSLSLALVALLAGAVLGHQWGWRFLPQRLALFVAAGLVGGVYWLTREEGVWLAPALAVLLGAAAVDMFLRWRSGEPAAAVRLAVITSAGVATAGLLASIIVGPIAFANLKTYGIFASSEFQGAAFPAAYGALSRIQREEWRRYVVFPKDAREKAYSVSAAARELRPSLEGGPGEAWRELGCRQTQTSPCVEFVSSLFMWALRDAVAAAGHYESGSESEAFYWRLADEINSACDDGRLACLPPRATFAPPFRWHYLTDALAVVPALLRVLATIGNSEIGSSPSSGPKVDIMSQLIGPVSRAFTPEEFAARRLRQFQLSVARLIARTYSIAIPVLAIVALLGFAAGLALRRLRVLLPGLFMLTAVCAAAVAGRIALLAYLDVTSIRTANVLYLSPASPFLLCFVVLGLYCGITTLRAAHWPPARFAALAFAVLALLSAASPAVAQPADTLLLNGKIVTLDEQSTIVQALAIENDRIIASGTSPEIAKHAGPRTRVIDLDGRTVIPGLIDSHIHAIRAGVRFTTEVSWIGATSIPEAMERIRAAAFYARPGTWIVVAGGWTPAQFDQRRGPTQAELVAAAPHHPVYVQLFYRAALLTPAGLAALGIASEADLPAASKFEHGEDEGWISGDSAAITGLYARLPPPALDESIEGTRRFLHELNRFGITGVFDPGGHNLAPEDYEALFRLWRAGGLTLRIAYSICSPRLGSELADLQTLTRFLPMGVGDGMLRFNGIGERVTWGMYNNDTPSEAQKEDFFRVARWTAERGMALTVHWNNDRSVHHLLDVFERVDREIPIRDLRWSIAHLHDASDQSLMRMKALGVGWLMQNGLYFAASSFLAGRGPVINRSPPLRSALQLGLHVGGGTDANRVMSYNPFVSLKWMTDGRTVDGMTTRAGAQLVSREEALRFYTQGSAWFTFDDDKRGTLQPGRLADLAVLDKDYLTVPADELGSLTSLLTMVGGTVVYAAGPFAGFRPDWPK